MDGIQRLVPSLDGGNDFIRVGGSCEGFGFRVVFVEKRLMAA